MQWREFSTSPQQGLDDWRHFISKNLIGVECEPLSHDNFHGAVRQVEVGNFGITNLACSAHRVHRSERQLDDSAKDYLVILLQKQGAVHIEHKGSDDDLGPAGIFIFDPSYPHEMKFHSDIGQTLLRFPKDSVSLRGIDPYKLAGAKVNCSSGIGRCFIEFVGSVADELEQCAEYDSQRLLETAVDLFKLTLQQNHSLLPEQLTSMQRQRLSQIRAYIEYNLDTPGLNAGLVSAHFNISRRYVDKLFSLTGETLSGWTKKRRLERCCRLLRDKDTSTMSITEVAYYAGFGDISYFNRAFKQHYHITPGQYRKSASVPGTKDLPL